MTADRNAQLAVWMQMYGDWLLRTCVFILQDYALAEDAVQETFLKAWHAADRFEGRDGCSEKTWLMRIAINTCSTMRHSAWSRHMDRHKLPEEMNLPSREEDLTLLMMVKSLPYKQRQVITLHYFSGCTMDDLAQVLGINRSTAHYRLQKALKTLRIAYKEGDDDHD